MGWGGAMEAWLTHPLVVLFLVIGLGLALGRLRVAGMTLGSSAVLFTALLAGHFGLGLYEGIGTVGLVLFVYCVGIGAGARFFAALAHEGQRLVGLAALVVLLGGLVAWGVGALMEWPADLTVGLFAGALTSTPALAAATERAGADSLVSIGYGIAYPFGVIGVVLFVQLWPRLMKRDLEAEGRALDKAAEAGTAIVSQVVEVTNPALTGQNIDTFRELDRLDACVTRVGREGRLAPLAYDDTFARGQQVLLVGKQAGMPAAVTLLGQASNDPMPLDASRERRQLVVTAPKFIGAVLGELPLLQEHGVTISRVSRLGFTFVATSETRLEPNDVLTVIGAPDALENFATALGHRSQAFEETDLLSLGLGIALGVLLGRLSIGVPNGPALSLGLVGGPLLFGLILGHLRRLGGLVGYIPRPTRLALQELGLALFLAEAGIAGGAALVETVVQYGPVLFLAGAVITLLPLIFGYLLATKLFGFGLLPTLGGICGGMTSTPALGAITAKTDAQAPVVSYATAYPIALVLMTLVAKLLLVALAG